MNDLPNYFGKQELCDFECQKIMNNDNLLRCAHLNKSQLHHLQLEQIRNGKLFKKFEALKKLQEKSEKRINYLELRTITERIIVPIFSVSVLTV